MGEHGNPATPQNIHHASQTKIRDRTAETHSKGSGAGLRILSCPAEVEPLPWMRSAAVSKGITDTKSIKNQPRTYCLTIIRFDSTWRGEPRRERGRRC